MKCKKLSKMSSDEILRQQLELLAEKSRKTKSIRKLLGLTSAMARICSLFDSYRP